MIVMKVIRGNKVEGEKSRMPSGLMGEEKRGGQNITASLGVISANRRSE